MAKKSHHVVPTPSGGWNVKKGGATRASRHFDNKQDAIQWGKQVSKNQKTDFVVHRKDGTIQSKENYRRGSKPSKGRE
jgi:uncharacterized protein YdaT